MTDLCAALLPASVLWQPLGKVHSLFYGCIFSRYCTQQSAGLVLADNELMTGLPEYRNGGLLLDMGLLQAKYPEVTSQPHSPEDEVCNQCTERSNPIQYNTGTSVNSMLGSRKSIEALPNWLLLRPTPVRPCFSFKS